MLKGVTAVSTVVYKLRVISPRSRDAPQRNKAHTDYIGRRSGVVLNEGMKHGLFGIIDGEKAEEVNSLQSISRSIEAKTREGAITYRAVISLTEEDAIRLGYDDPEAFRELVRTSLPNMCGKIGIPLQNLEYVAAIHRDKGHPHVHIEFWDKAQDVKKKAYVHKAVSNAIRVDLIKQVFGEEMSDIQALKYEARKAALDNMGGFFGGFIDTFVNMTPREYAEAVERLSRESDLAHGRLMYNRFKSEDIRELAALFLNIAGHVPRTGRLNYKFMPPEIKSEIETFILKILEKNADCDREFKKYVSSAIELSKFYSDDPETHKKAGKAAYDDMISRLGNSVLRHIKKLDKPDRNAENLPEKEIHQRAAVESLIFELFSLLSRFANAENNKTTHAKLSGELSKQAKKEIALKLENSSGYDWGENSL